MTNEQYILSLIENSAEGIMECYQNGTSKSPNGQTSWRSDHRLPGVVRAERHARNDPRSAKELVMPISREEFLDRFRGEMAGIVGECWLVRSMSRSDFGNFMELKGSQTRKMMEAMYDTLVEPLLEPAKIKQQIDIAVTKPVEAAPEDPRVKEVLKMLPGVNGNGKHGR